MKSSSPPHESFRHRRRATFWAQYWVHVLLLLMIVVALLILTGAVWAGTSTARYIKRLCK